MDPRDFLCWYDPRNPDYIETYGDDDDAPKPREDCACDNCYRGGDELALLTLDLLAALEELVARREWLGTEAPVLERARAAIAKATP